MTPRPYLDRGADGFDFGVELQHSVAHLAAPAGLLVAAEGQRCVEEVVAVDPHGYGAQDVCNTVPFADVTRPTPAFQTPARTAPKSRKRSGAANGVGSER